MFDIGFLELLMIMIIALIVIGPERMPEVARKLGSFMGKTRRFIENVKQENQVQETINDFKQSMNLDEEKEKLSKLQNELQESLDVGTNPSSLDDLNLGEISRPFGDSPSTGGQFNRAPAQPQMPGSHSQQASAPANVTPSPVAETSAPVAQNTAPKDEAPAASTPEVSTEKPAASTETSKS